MYFKTHLTILVLTFVMLFGVTNVQAQCYPGEIVTAVYATGGTSPYINDVLWLTWGSTNQENFPYGRNAQQLGVGSKSRASIPLGDDKYLCIEAEIMTVNGPVNSYTPGNYSGDFLDDLYNIGGVGGNNQLVSGIINRTSSSSSLLTLKCTATLDGVPIRIPGVVFADAESLAPTEYIYATADGNWTLVEVHKNLALTAPYDVRKETVASSSQTTMKFLRGNDRNTMAVAFLKFNESAYDKNGTDPDFSVSIEVDFKGNGLTAIALGLLAPEVDGGDAPASYGNPLHLIQKLNFTPDNITPQGQLGGSSTNINTSGYIPGALVPNTSLSYLGSTAPDTETVAQNSKDAMGDDNNGLAGPLEEDAWPEEYKRFSYKVNYIPGNVISANIPYKSETDGYIAGWIDFNANGVFDPGEKREVFAPATGNAMGTVLLEWTIPGTRKPYSTYVRLRLSELPNMTPTQFLNTGEVEDHRIYVLSPAVTNPMIHSRAKEKPID